MIFRILFLALFCVFSISCSSNKPATESTPSQDQPEVVQANKSAVSVKAEKRSKRVKSLELPPDLVSSASDTIRGNTAVDAEISVLPDIVDARIQQQDGKAWLEIDTNVESAWATISEHWASNGISLVEYNPAAGTMETEWIKKEIVLDEDDSTIKQLFKGFLNSVVKRNTSLDKYRIRFERLSPNKTAMFVSHRATVRRAIEHRKEVASFAWVELPENSERVIDFLQNIILIFARPT